MTLRDLIDPAMALVAVTGIAGALYFARATWRAAHTDRSNP